MDTLAKREEAYTGMLQVKFDFRSKFFNQGEFTSQPELDINHGKV